jgi:hypothetical protein
VTLFLANAQWYGSDHPGSVDPSDPYHNDWYCDKYGNWHNDEHDGFGHKNARCHPW